MEWDVIEEKLRGVKRLAALAGLAGLRLARLSNYHQILYTTCGSNQETRPDLTDLIYYSLLGRCCLVVRVGVVHFSTKRLLLRLDFTSPHPYPRPVATAIPKALCIVHRIELCADNERRL